MASAPLFVADLATLTSKLRLTGVASGDSGTPLIDEGILQARNEIYLRLGASTIATIQATAFTDNPTTADQYTRSLANSVEVKMVRLRLMRSMPMMFIDGTGGDAMNILHDEAPYRDTSAFDLRAEMNMLEAEIDSDLAILTGADADGSPNKAFSIGPAVTPPLPFGTIWPA
jgi:hypothetical protein